MSKFVRDVLIFIGINALILGYLYAIYDIKSDYFASVNDTFDRLEQKPPPRLLFVGGSSVAWSHHSQIVQDAFPKYEVENMAYHAGLGLNLRLSEARKFSQPGDVVVLSIEWGVFTDEPTPRVMSEASLACPRILTLMHPRDLKVTADGMLAALKMPFAAFINNAKEHGAKALTYEIAQKRKKFRRRVNFSDMGDFTGHYTAERPGIAGKVVLLATEEQFMDGVRRINELRVELEKKNVKLIYFVPICAEQGYTPEKEGIERQLQLLKDHLEVPILNPDIYVYPNDDYFDSCYHMMEEAGIRRTKMLSERLREHLETEHLEGR